MEARARHLRDDPATMNEGTNVFGKYGIQFSLTALIVNLVIYFMICMAVIHGLCRKRQASTNLEPDEVENEDEDIKAERERIADQLNG